MNVQSWYRKSGVVTKIQFDNNGPYAPVKPSIISTKCIPIIAKLRSSSVTEQSA